MGQGIRKRNKHVTKKNRKGRFTKKSNKNKRKAKKSLRKKIGSNDIMCAMCNENKGTLKFSGIGNVCKWRDSAGSAPHHFCEKCWFEEDGSGGAPHVFDDKGHKMCYGCLNDVPYPIAPAPVIVNEIF
tara:strand:- start:936 stop:1319 length:384 start_codon:yes stop_codon:yes gene_type:complete